MVKALWVVAAFLYLHNFRGHVFLFNFVDSLRHIFHLTVNLIFPFPMLRCRMCIPCTTVSSLSVVMFLPRTLLSLKGAAVATWNLYQCMIFSCRTMRNLTLLETHKDTNVNEICSHYAHIWYTFLTPLMLDNYDSIPYILKKIKINYYNKKHTQTLRSEGNMYLSNQRWVIFCL